MVSAPRSLSLTLVFWWGVYLVIQSAERMFLVATAITRDPPTAATLATTLRAGFRADLMGAAGGIVLAVVLGLVIGASLAIAKRWRKGQAVPESPWKVGITVGAVGVALLMLAVATADMGYYRYSQRRVDLAFLESVIDVFSPPTRARLDSNLVDRQTAAQLSDGARWVGYAATFAGSMAAAIVAWWLAFTRAVGPLLRRCIAAAPRTSAAVLVLALFATGTSFDRESRLEVYRVSIVSSTYYMLAQNPFWSISDTLDQVIGARVAGTEAALLRTVPEETAVRVTRETVAPGATFPSPRYPLVHTTVGESGERLARPDQRGGRRPSILMIFVEGLDRRFLGRTVGGIRVTPFFDRLRGETVYFEHSFSGLRRDGLLRNTVVLILGDHGRHGRIGRTDAEAMVGNFLAPLFVWMDESLVDPTLFRPRTVSLVASQVDLPPTILSMTGLMPALTPFVGRDLSCAFVRECLANNVAYLSNVSENLLGLVDRDGIWMYPVQGGRATR